MSKRTRFVAASAVTGFLLGLPALAGPAMDSMAMSHGYGGMAHAMMSGGDSHFMKLLKSANLTPAQHAQVRQILENEKGQMKGIYDGFHAVHEQLAAKLLSPGPVTAGDLAPLEQKASRYQQQITRDMIDTALAIRNILTPEQLARLAQVHQQLQSLHEQIHNLMGSDSDEAPDTSE